MERRRDVLPVGQWQTEKLHRQHRGHRTGEVMDQVAFAGLTEPVDERVGDLAKERSPGLGRRGGELRVEQLAVLVESRGVDLQRDELHRRRRNRGALMAVAFAGHVVVRRERLVVERDGLDVLVPRNHPVPTVRLGPRDGTLRSQVGGDASPVVGECRPSGGRNRWSGDEFCSRSQSHQAHKHVLGLGEFADAVDAAQPAPAALFGTAERDGGRNAEEAVDPDVADLELLGDRVGTLEVRGLDIAGQTER